VALCRIQFYAARNSVLSPARCCLTRHKSAARVLGRI
jgi:hypothetical protein